MENSIVVSETKSPTLFEMQPNQMISFASDMAKSLADVIRKQRLYTSIQGKDYVRVEGWTTLGSMLGFLPREVSVHEHSDGSYEAKVELYSLKTGQVVGQASALCSIDEKRWGNADKFARRSMAITRATGKAYRLGFSWIMTLAGYEPTPAEEMPEIIEVPFEGPKASFQAKKSESKPAAVYQGREDQQQIVFKILKAQKVPEEYWEEIHNKMIGRPVDALKGVVDEVRLGL